MIASTLGLLGERTHGRVGRRLVARDDQEPIGSGFSSSPSELTAQASATPRPFGVVGRWKAAQPVRVEPSR